jgi:hypothetical protein
VTSTDQSPSAPIGDDTASVLLSVAGTIELARAALAAGDPLGATNEASPLLYRVERVLDELSGATAEDRDVWPLVSALRDEIGSYLLAAKALEESGVAQIVTVALLRRGTNQAQQRVDRLAHGHGA